MKLRKISAMVLMWGSCQGYIQATQLCEGFTSDGFCNLLRQYENQKKAEDLDLNFHEDEIGINLDNYERTIEWELELEEEAKKIFPLKQDISLEQLYPIYGPFLAQGFALDFWSDMVKVFSLKSLQREDQKKLVLDLRNLYVILYKTCCFMYPEFYQRGALRIFMQPYQIFLSNKNF